MNTATIGKEDESIVSAQLRGETVGYALQSGALNLVGNLFEPYVNYRIQKRYSDHAHRGHQYGSYTQNLLGEFAGDIVGSSTLIAAEMAAPQALHSFTRSIRSAVDPIYDAAARQVFSKDCNKPDYEQKVENWKVFQERNLVRSAIIMSSGVAGNIATQKLLLKNPSPTKLIFLGKLASSALNTALGLTTRMVFPNHMRRIDRWVGECIAPMMDDKHLKDNEKSIAR